MIVEHRTESEGTEDPDVHFSSAAIGGENRTMWVSSDQPESAMHPLGSIAAQCGLARFMGDQSEYFKTRELVMNHLWLKHGGEQ